ncbi:MAG: hypothetical protein NTZ04_01980 [Chloroflexi bacterium]|nr:hypothetical protein [Chloroflexota bacterium]
MSRNIAVGLPRIVWTVEAVNLSLDMKGGHYAQVAMTTALVGFVSVEGATAPRAGAGGGGSGEVGQEARHAGTAGNPTAEFSQEISREHGTGGGGHSPP